MAKIEEVLHAQLSRKLFVRRIPSGVSRCNLPARPWKQAAGHPLHRRIQDDDDQNTRGWHYDQAGDQVRSGESRIPNSFNRRRVTRLRFENCIQYLAIRTRVNHVLRRKPERFARVLYD